MFADCGDDEGKANVTDLNLCTGLEAIPPMGLVPPITLEYMDREAFLTASACYSILRLPVVADEITFLKNMDRNPWE